MRDAEARLADLRAKAAGLERDAPVEVPLEVRLPRLPPDAPIGGLEVENSYEDRLEAVEISGPTLGEMARAAGLPEEAGTTPAAWDAWTAGAVRAVVSALATRLGQSSADLLARAATAWRRDEAARKKGRRAERERLAAEVERAEAHLADFRTLAALPTPAEWQELRAMEAAARRALDRSLRTLRSVQLDRRQRAVAAGSNPATGPGRRKSNSGTGPGK